MAALPLQEFNYHYPILSSGMPKKLTGSVVESVKLWLAALSAQKEAFKSSLSLH